MTTFPPATGTWPECAPVEAGLDPAAVADAVRFAESHETSWPRSIHVDGAMPGMTADEEPPFNEILGPIPPRGGANGLILSGGRLCGRWGDPDRADMTFSVAKSYLSVLAGLALEDGLIADLDRPLADETSIPAELFTGAHNSRVTWRHLLHQTSEWEGTLFSKPDRIDRNRRLGPDADNTRKGAERGLQPPGSFWEYNDVRVNVLSLSLLHLFRQPLPAVLKARIMDPIGASDTWDWFGYRNSTVRVGEEELLSVPGGTHWGGGIRINAFDHARFGLLIHAGGNWNGRQIIAESWTRALREPCPVEPGYGFLWWLNTARAAWPGASEASYAAVGAGSHIIWIDPDRDIIAVARWIDQSAVPEFVRLVSAAA